MAEPMRRVWCTNAGELRVRGPDDVVRFVRATSVASQASMRSSSPRMAVVGLSPEWRVTGAFEQRRCFGHAGVGALQLASCAVSLHARRLVLVWLVSDGAGAPVPPRLEVDAAVELGRSCLPLGVALLDSIVVSGHRWWSCREISLATRCEKRAETVAQRAQTA
jgi:hypothetical protein